MKPLRRKTAFFRTICYLSVTSVIMHKIIAAIITLATLGAAVYLFSRSSGNTQTTAVLSTDQTISQTTQPATQGNQYRWGQQNTQRPNPSTTTQTS
jgi:hypothetical protein